MLKLRWLNFTEALGVDSASAAYYATSVINEFLSFSVGKNVNKAKILTPEQKMMAQKLSQDELANLLYSKISPPRSLQIYLISHY
ncbi:hypothetical protein VB002_14905 [Campylobacter concisus]